MGCEGWGGGNDTSTAPAPKPQGLRGIMGVIFEALEAPSKLRGFRGFRCFWVAPGASQCFKIQSGTLRWGISLRWPLPGLVDKALVHPLLFDLVRDGGVRSSRLECC